MVLVNRVGGDLLCYRPLVESLRGRYRVLGLSSAGVTPGSTIEDMAARYLAELTPALGDGPVRLAGWSLGATVAYEMARRLRRADRDCRVVMIDPWLRCPDHSSPDAATLVRSFLHNLAGAAVTVPDLPADATLALRQVWSSPPPELSVVRGLAFAELHAMFHTFEANTRALLRYAVTPEDGLAVTVVEASATAIGPAGGYLVPWRRAVPPQPGTSFRTLAGDHFTVVDERHADELATLIGTDR